MSNPLHNLDDALEALQSKAIHTTQGAFVRLADVQEWAQQFRDSDQIEKETIPHRMSPLQARRMAMRDPEVRAAFGPPRQPQLGRSIPAGPSADEGVKA